MELFTKETIDTIIRIGGNGTLKQNKIKETLMEILDHVSTIDKSGWMADFLTKDFDNNKSPYRGITNRNC